MASWSVRDFGLCSLFGVGLKASCLLTPEEARLFMLGHHQLNRFSHQGSAEGLRKMLSQMRCIQLDPLSPMGTSPDMVALARCDLFRCGDLFALLFPGGCFEHFAKERCLLPPDAFPFYRDRVKRGIWPRFNSWMAHCSSKVPEQVVAAVLADVRSSGPLLPSQLGDYGQVVPMDWQGWKGTAKMATMALEILWARCQIVVSGRKGREKLYDLPERALPEFADCPCGDYDRWSLLTRVDAAGLLPLNTGPHWSMLDDVRKSPLPAQLVDEGLLVVVSVSGSPRRYLAPAGFRGRLYPSPDDHLRILGPLDPLLWFRPLVLQIFDFEYIWEVYKPARVRRWGWYVCPLLHCGRLVGRLEGKFSDGLLNISNVWREPDVCLDRDALSVALKRHVASLGGQKFRLPRRFRAPVKAR